MQRTEAQEKAVTRKKSMIVTAGAGTGKTSVLVDRYLELLKKVDTPRKLLALTFTEKAATEMKDRVRSSISTGEGMVANRARALDDFNWAEIQTFHSFCSNVLRQYPLEAGVSPDFDVLEEPEKDAILQGAMDKIFYSPRPNIRQSVVDILTMAGLSNAERYLRALYDRRFLSRELFERLLSEDISEQWKREVADHKDSVVRGILDDVDFIRACSILYRLASVYKGDKDAGTQYLLEAEPHISDIISGGSVETAGNAVLNLTRLKGRSNMGNKSNFKPDDLTAFREAYTALRKTLDRHRADEELDLEDDQFIDHAVTFLRDLETVFSEFSRLVAEEKRARNGLDFTDLLILVRNLFSNNENFVKQHYADRYAYILVDEMQDTDALQLEIIRALVKHSDMNRLGKLFVVGDPKQSIYQFRDVDVSLFKETGDYIKGDLSGEEIKLDVNFRSAPQVVCFVNRLFSRIMNSSERPWEFEYDRIECSNNRKDDLGSVELLMVPDSLRSVERKMAEAEIVARRIDQLMPDDTKKVYWNRHDRCKNGHAVKYGDICILLRSRTNLQFYEHALKAFNIPYHVHKGVGFYNSQEVIDTYNLLRFLDDPDNDVALLGLLRSPFFSISDADIFRAVVEGRGALFWQLKKNDETRNSPKIAKAVERLEQWLQYAHRETTSDLLARALTESQISAVFAGIPGGDQKIANLEKLQAMIRTWQQAGFISIADVARTLDNNIHGETKEGDATLDMSEDNSVNIMTIHAAKGLEFPVVIVPEIDRSPSDSQPSIHLDRQHGLGLKIPDPTGSNFRSTLALKRIEAISREKRTAEEKRLFYVATTRAKDHLILSGQPGIEKKKDWSEDDKSGYWMSLLKEGLSLDISDFNAGSKEVTDGEVKTTMSFISFTPETSGVEVGTTGTTPERLVVDPRPCPKEPIKSVKEPPQVEIDNAIVYNVLQGTSSRAAIRKLDVPSDALTDNLIKELDELRSRFLNCDLMNDVVSDKKDEILTYNEGEQEKELRIDRLVTSDRGEMRAIKFILSRPGKEELEKEIEEMRKQATSCLLNPVNNLPGPLELYLYFAQTGEIKKIID
jgi:ATP-dependent helicase/nuclease subunit A